MNTEEIKNLKPGVYRIKFQYQTTDLALVGYDETGQGPWFVNMKHIAVTGLTHRKRGAEEWSHVEKLEWIDTDIDSVPRLKAELKHARTAYEWVVSQKGKERDEKEQLHRKCVEYEERLRHFEQQRLDDAADGTEGDDELRREIGEAVLGGRLADHQQIGRLWAALTCAKLVLNRVGVEDANETLDAIAGAA